MSKLTDNRKNELNKTQMQNSHEMPQKLKLLLFKYARGGGIIGPPHK
jgi:hypothetical protein